MGAVQDLISLLDKVPIWKKIQELPNETDLLKERVSKLEELFKNPVPKWCPACKKQALNLENGNLKEGDIYGVYYRNWVCGECGNKIKQYTDLKSVWIPIEQN